MSTVTINADGFEVEVITGKTGGKPQPGEANGMSSLTNEDARNMRIMRSNGWALRDLAWLFGVSPGRASEICRGKSYKDAGGPVEEGPRGYNTSLGRSPGDLPDLRARIVALHLEGRSQRSIAAEVGKPKTFVFDTIRRYRDMGEAAA